MYCFMDDFGMKYTIEYALHAWERLADIAFTPKRLHGKTGNEARKQVLYSYSVYCWWLHVARM